ncbi:oxysterol-binding protein 1-like [Cimex lectularius]|uniref:Oxysterol-binding protein n=1 Tax=Cimex lectularius TaxID=79782 RepID=A0A8I6TLH1_CIMLE|nr:oxysterol-binding protein 1-like [Cimex lectularius]
MFERNSNTDFAKSKLKYAYKRKKYDEYHLRPLPKIPLWPAIRDFQWYELYKIIVPLDYTEPLSFLQRLTEDFEYAHLLNKAAQIADSLEQCAYVAAFAISAYSSTAERLAKPFNPILGETFEFDNLEKGGWRSLAEQVSNRPPTTAFFVEGRKWKLSQLFSMHSTFPGNKMEFSPITSIHLEFESGNKYRWGKVKTVLHDIIHGNPFIDNEGFMEIINETTDEICNLSFFPYDVLNKNYQRKVLGCILDKSGETRWTLDGKWDKGVRIARVQTVIDDDGIVSYQRGLFKTIWKCDPLPDEDPGMYHMPNFARQLNMYEEKVAPTDSRRRIDIRAFELGDLQQAAFFQMKIEGLRRKQLRTHGPKDSECTPEGLPFFPTWFIKLEKEDTKETLYKYNNEYWESKARGSWFICPNIYPPDLKEQ